jgi:diguanylate cyclase (GGDEF)-like protein
MTGHLSRRGLSVAIAARAPSPATVILTDLDGLRSINQTLGVAAGDAAVTAFSRLLQAPLLPDDSLVARVDGARFVIWLPGLDVRAAGQLARQLQNKLERVEIKGENSLPRMTASCGIAEASAASGLIEKALFAADLVLTRAKARGPSSIETHESGDASDIRRSDDVFAVADLRDAMRQRTLELFAQPIISFNNTAHPPSFELLLRMRDDSGHLIEPGRMLAAAQRHQLLPALDRYVVEEIFARLAPLRTMLVRQRVTLCINISAQSFGDPAFTDYFIEQLRKSRVPPYCIIVEVTEQVAEGNLDRAADAMARLREAGCGIALDDFGTGPNSLAYVHRLPVTRLKIDGSFVADITTHERSAAAVKNIVQLAHDFGLKTVAEFVENSQQSETLRRLGVDYGQGYLYGHAEPLDAVMARLVEQDGPAVCEILHAG